MTILIIWRPWTTLIGRWTTTGGTLSAFTMCRGRWRFQASRRSSSISRGRGGMETSEDEWTDTSGEDESMDEDEEDE